MLTSNVSLHLARHVTQGTYASHVKRSQSPERTQRRTEHSGTFSHRARHAAVAIIFYFTGHNPPRIDSADRPAPVFKFARSGARVSCSRRHRTVHKQSTIVHRFRRRRAGESSSAASYADTRGNWINAALESIKFTRKRQSCVRNVRVRQQ